MTEANYQICTRCVMDTSDPDIVFGLNGVCHHCINFDEVTTKRWFPNAEGKKKLDSIIQGIKESGKKQEYDCIIGLSGGVDSSYLALVLNEYDLNPLVVHVDAGWNSELAVHNIEKVVKYCGYELHTHVMDWEEMKDLQLSYLKSGVANQDVVQDHAFFSSLYHYAVSNNIKYVMSGGNIATESVFPQAWHHSAMDAINIHAIHKRYGNLKLKHFKTISFLNYFFYYPFVRKMSVIRPLDYMPYHKEKALQTLIEKIGYVEYGRKHGESRFTKFFQNYYLPKKFSMDKRRPHLSSQILSGEISRDDALLELEKPLYVSDELAEDKAYVAKKLGLTEKELDRFIESPGHEYTAYRNWNKYYRLMKKTRHFLEKYTGKAIKSYS